MANGIPDAVSVYNEYFQKNFGDVGMSAYYNGIHKAMLSTKNRWEERSKARSQHSFPRWSNQCKTSQHATTSHKALGYITTVLDTNFGTTILLFYLRNVSIQNERQSTSKLKLEAQKRSSAPETRLRIKGSNSITEKQVRLLSTLVLPTQGFQFLDLDSAIKSYILQWQHDFQQVQRPTYLMR